MAKKSSRSNSRNRSKGGSRSRQRRAGSIKQSSIKKSRSVSTDGAGPGEGLSRRPPRAAGRPRANASAGLQGRPASRRDAADAKKKEKKDGLLSRLNKKQAVSQFLDLMQISEAGGGTTINEDDAVFDEEHLENVDTLFNQPHNPGLITENAARYGEEISKLKTDQPNLTRKEAAREATKRVVARLNIRSQSS